MQDLFLILLWFPTSGEISENHEKIRSKFCTYRSLGVRHVVCNHVLLYFGASGNVGYPSASLSKQSCRDPSRFHFRVLFLQWL